MWQSPRVAEPNEPGAVNRREMLRASIAAAMGALVPSCSVPGIPQPGPPVVPRLSARPAAPTSQGPAGKSTFQVSGSTAVIYVPRTVQRTTASGLYVFLHGALRTVDFFVDGHTPAADRHGVIVLAPFSTSGTWDAIQGRFSNDVRVIDSALRWTFERWTIDPMRIAMTGFSDGGTYSLAMGRANGDLFTRIVACSPGFLIGVERAGNPPILVTHGTQDAVLPIEQTSRLLVPQLRSLGYTVDYREFVGPHAVPISIAEEVVQSLAAPR